MPRTTTITSLPQPPKLPSPATVAATTIGHKGVFGYAFGSQQGCLVRCLTAHKGAFGTAAPIRGVLGFD
ncbi:hypothetical protein Tco_1491206 [Tanacetum coccineum]